jgi:hypothetical protein
VTFEATVTELPRPAGRLGYIGKLCVRGDEVFAVGGTYHAPTVLHAKGDLVFERWLAPATSGLRDLYLDGKRLWVVGEYGWIASAGMPPKRWKRHATEAAACLYSIERDLDGRFWITGDDGLVLRSVAEGGFEKLRTHTKGRVLSLFMAPEPWILDTTGTLQRWDGMRFVVVPVPALRTKHSLNQMMRSPSGALVVAANGGAVLRSANGVVWKKSPTHVRTMIEAIAATRYGCFAVGEAGTLLVSYDDARTFTAIATAMTGHLWSVAAVANGILVGGDDGRIYHMATAELGRLMAAAYAGHDDVLAGLAGHVAASEAGAEMVLEDALRERGLWV